MKIAIQSIADAGNPDKERVVLRVASDADIGDYLLMQTGFVDGEVTIGVHHTYWFPYKKIEAGDLVVLYSKSGTENVRKLKNGKVAHFFYWGIDSAIWDRNDKAAVLLFAAEWVSKNPGKL